MLFGNQKDHSYLINCIIVSDLSCNGSIFFIACVCIAIVPYENCVYLFDSHSRNSFGVSTANGFSTCMKFPNYESVALYIYSLFVNSSQVEFENQFIKCNISNFFSRYK